MNETVQKIIVQDLATAITRVAWLHFIANREGLITESLVGK